MSKAFTIYRFRFPVHFRLVWSPPDCRVVWTSRPLSYVSRRCTVTRGAGVVTPIQRMYILFVISSLDRLLNLELSWFRRSSTTATSSDGAVSEFCIPQLAVRQEGSSVAMRVRTSLPLNLFTCAEKDAESDSDMTCSIFVLYPGQSTCS